MSFVLVDRPRPEIALVTLNRPERMNAMAFDVMLPFKQMLVDISHDNDVRAVVITGAGKGFVRAPTRSRPAPFRISAD